MSLPFVISVPFSLVNHTLLVQASLDMVIKPILLSPRQPDNGHRLLEAPARIRVVFCKRLCWIALLSSETFLSR